MNGFLIIYITALVILVGSWIGEARMERHHRKS